MARIITTPEERDALPVHSVIRDNDPHAWVTVYERMPDGWYGLGFIDEPHTPPLPATLLYTPED